MKIKLTTLSKRVCKGIEGKRNLSMRNEDSARIVAGQAMFIQFAGTICSLRLS